MISATKIKETYESACGYTLYNDYGSVTQTIREKNEIVYSVCGLFKMQPVQLTAIRAPFIGVASANIEIIAPTHMMEEVRTKLNTEVAAALNGVSISFPDEEDEQKTYSVSFTVQTCTIGEKADIGAWYGECVTLYQTISFVIIEQGVSSYDTVLKIDGMTVPLLSLSETKVHTTSVYPSANAIGRTASEQEAYGIDFATPYVKSDLCKLFHEAVNGCTGNNAHCVEITKNGITNAYIMAISAAADSVQPPSNIGFNISLTEVSPTIARFNGRWSRYTHTGNLVTDGRISPKADVVFWGDGSFSYPSQEKRLYHVYTDGKKTHDIMCYENLPLDATREIKKGDVLGGVKVYVSVENENGTITAEELFNTYGFALLASRTLGLCCDKNRIYWTCEDGYGYIDEEVNNAGDMGLRHGSSFIYPSSEPIGLIIDSNHGVCFRVRYSELSESEGAEQ